MNNFFGENFVCQRLPSVTLSDWICERESARASVIYRWAPDEFVISICRADVRGIFMRSRYNSIRSKCLMMKFENFITATVQIDRKCVWSLSSFAETNVIFNNRWYFVIQFRATIFLAECWCIGVRVCVCCGLSPNDGTICHTSFVFCPVHDFIPELSSFFLRFLAFADKSEPMIAPWNQVHSSQQLSIIADWVSYMTLCSRKQWNSILCFSICRLVSLLSARFVGQQTKHSAGATNKWSR